jgi:hypothetical protein
MGYLKTLTNKDVIITPFIVNKQFTSSGDTPSYNDGGIISIVGNNTPYPLSGGLEGTGSYSLVYNSIKQLYYGNYLEDGDNGLVSNAATASFNPDGTVTGPRYTTDYNNNIQSIDERRYFPTQSNASITVVSIPTTKFGNFIKPGSVLFTYAIEAPSPVYTAEIADDGQGNLTISSQTTPPGSTVSEVGDNVGNIIYESGLIILTGGSTTSWLGNNNTEIIDVSWESSVTIYETQYKCTMRASEFNYSTNPTLITSSSRGQNNILTSGSATYSDFVTGSVFSPFVTAVGLYNDNQELLAVGKLAQPLQTSQTTDTTILINIDK